MTAQIPSAVFPVAPPLAQLKLIDLRTGNLTPLGINFMTQLWAGLQGKGGVKDDTDTLFGMHGDATIDDTGLLTISDDAITTPKIADDAVTVDKLADDAVETVKIKDANVTLAKLAALAGAGILGADSAGPVALITIGAGLLLAAGALQALTPPQAVSALPATGQPGERRMVNDATTPAFGSPVVGGGAVVVPVYWDSAGGAWNVG